MDGKQQAPGRNAWGFFVALFSILRVASNLPLFRHFGIADDKVIT